MITLNTDFLRFFGPLKAWPESSGSDKGARIVDVFQRSPVHSGGGAVEEAVFLNTQPVLGSGSAT